MANIEGNNSANTLNGTSGDDVINGYGGNDTINGGTGGADLIHGGSGNDSITGSSGGNNTIQGSSGNDSIFGGSFDDLLDGGTGNDTLNGWDGNDTIDGGDGFDLIYGGTSDDTLIGRGGDTVYGGEDWDVLISAGGENYLYGENGRDQLGAHNGGNSSVAHVYGGLGEDVAWSARALDGSHEGQAMDARMGEGNDSVFAGEWNVWAYGEAGDDLLLAGSGGGTKFLSGGDGNDTLEGRDLNGELGTLTGQFYGDAGMDTFITTYAAGSTNLMDGGTDQDTFVTDTRISAGDSIIGGEGYDIFDGSALTQAITQAIGGARIANTAAITGIEYYISGSGDDWFNLTQNNTTLYTNGGNDLIYINAANSSVDAGSGDDSVTVTSMKNTTFNSFIGGDGTDWVYVGGSTGAVIDLNGVLQIGTASGGLHGFESVSATSGNDTITGNSSGNWLFGNAGADRINGAEGNDEIFGGAGRDTLTGGAGSDVFHFTTGDTGTGSSADQITDFVRNKDDIDVSGLGATTYRGTGAFTGTAGELRYAQSGANTIIQIDANGDGTADSHIRLNFYSSGLSASDFIF